MLFEWKWFNKKKTANRIRKKENEIMMARFKRNNNIRSGGV